MMLFSCWVQLINGAQLKFDGFRALECCCFLFPLFHACAYVKWLLVGEGGPEVEDAYDLFPRNLFLISN